MQPLILLLATSLALAQDPTFLTVLPPPPESSELDPVTIETRTSSYTTVVSFDTSAINFVKTLADGRASLVTIVTKDPGPPQTTVITTTNRITRTKTEYPSLSSTPSSSSSNTTPSSSPSIKSTTLNTTSTSSTSTTPGVSTSPTPATTDAPPAAKKGIGITSIVLIVFGIITAFAMVGSGAFFMKKRRAREQVEERNAAYRNREWNSARPPISSPLNTANLTDLNNMVTAPRSNTPTNIPPSRPPRPASLSESVQESMRMMPIAGMRKATGSVRSGGTALTMVSGARSMSPDPLNIVKKGAASRDRSDTYSSTTPHFGDYHTRSSSGIESSQLDQLQELERELEEEARTGIVSGKGSYVQIEPHQAEGPGNSAGYAGHGHASPPPTLPERAYAIPREPRFSDPDEDDEDVRAARRASAQRKLDGESIRSTSTSPPMFDSIAARAEKQRFIAQKQRLIAEQQKKMVGKEKNITDFGAGPMPNYSPPPPPGPPPSGYF